jgi:hypothetical protein
MRFGPTLSAFYVGLLLLPFGLFLMLLGMIGPAPG